MKKVILNVFSAIILISCQKPNQSTLTSVKDEKNISYNNNCNINYANIKQYYKNDTLYGWYVINTKKFKAPHYFTEKEVYQPIQENPFYFYKIKNNQKYYVIDSCDYNNNLIKLIIYETIGDNDINIINIKLNSYNKKKELIDALLLDQRLTFETEYYREFFIKGKNIKIKKYEIEHLIYDEDWNIIDTKKNPDTIITVVNYEITKQGKFKNVN